MEIYFEQLRIYASSLVVCLNDNHLVNTSDLEGFLGRRLFIPEKREFVLVHKSPSNSGTWAYKLSYTLTNPQMIPLEVVLNHSMGYGQVFAKCRQHIVGYAPFAWDISGNGVQSRPFNPADLSLAKLALADLSNVENDRN
jgi:hypothetical protein